MRANSLWKSAAFFYYGTHVGAKSPVAESPGHRPCHVGRATRISKRGTLAGVGLERSRPSPRRSLWGRFWRRDSTRRARCRDRCSGRSPRLGNARSLSASGSTRRSRVAVAWRAAATGPTDGGLRLDRSGSNTGVNANAPKRGDEVSASAYSAGASKDREDIFVDASRSKVAAGGAAVVARAGAETDGEPPTALPRAVAGGIVAETAGQLAESAHGERGASSSIRSAKRKQRSSAGSCADVPGDRRTRPGHAQAEIKRAGVATPRVSDPSAAGS